MPYFQDLADLMGELGPWADLRHEQGAPVKPVIKRLRKELLRAKEDLLAMRPKKKMRDLEPNKLIAIRRLRPDGPRWIWRRFQKRGLQNRLRGAWLGRAAGCTLGAAVEGWDVAAMESLAALHRMAFPPEDYWAGHPQPESLRYEREPVSAYLQGRIKAVPMDDDLVYTLLGLLILEAYGPTFTTEAVAEVWLKYLPTACTAEKIALENLRAGIPPKMAAGVNNPYQEWIGADIRCDPWGYAAPGLPEKAAEMAYRDARLTHRQNGIYGAMFFAAALSAAFTLDCPLKALDIGLTEIPADCRLARDLRWARDLAPQLQDWRAARAAVDQRFAGMHPVHTNNNACLTVFGLHLGQKDFTRTIGTTVAMGLDNDCTAATAASILGAVIGAKHIPEHWWKPFRNRTRTYLIGHEQFSNTDIVKRFYAQAQRLWETL